MTRLAPVPKLLTALLISPLSGCGETSPNSSMTEVTGAMPTSSVPTMPVASVAPTPSVTATGPTAPLPLDVCTNPELDDLSNTVVRAGEGNNYSFASSLTFSPTTVMPNSNLTFDWSGLTTSFLGHPVDVIEDIDMVSLMMWRLDQAELQAKLNDDSLAQADLVTPSMFYPDLLRQARPEEMGTSAMLLREGTDEFGEPAMVSDLTLFMNPLTPEEFMPYFDNEAYPPGEHIYTLIAATGTELGRGTHMMHAFTLDPTSTNTEVVLTDQSTALDYTVDLQTLTPTRVPANTSAISINWRDMMTNALGNEFTPTSIQYVRVSRYLQTPAELEAQFLDLELIADTSYSAEVPAGTSADLSALTNEAGQPFAGIDGTGTWLLALMCGSCRNPAPWYITTLVPCDG